LPLSARRSDEEPARVTFGGAVITQASLGKRAGVEAAVDDDERKKELEEKESASETERPAAPALRSRGATAGEALLRREEKKG
jgi:hypothetical protein